MNWSKVMGIQLAVLPGGLFAGCMPKMTIEDVKSMRPQRPAELGKLNAFVGQWEWEGNATFAGLDRTLCFTGKNEATLGCDGWCLVSREVGHMEELGETHGLATWAYDERCGRFRTTWADSMGSIGTGTAWYDETTDTWQFRTKSSSPFGKASGTGRVKFTDPNTMDWHWTEYATGGLIKTVDLSGISRRQPTYR